MSGRHCWSPIFRSTALAPATYLAPRFAHGPGNKISLLPNFLVKQQTKPDRLPPDMQGVLFDKFDHAIFERRP